MGDDVSDGIPTRHLRYAPAKGQSLEQMRLNVPKRLRAAGDVVLVWVNEGDLCFVGMQVADDPIRERTP